MVLIGTLLVIAGIVGCIVPVLPGPPVAFAALLLVSWAGSWAVYPLWILILLAALAVFAALMDSILPVAASRRAGAHKTGVWGSVAGMLAGTIFFPPFGTIIGAFLGALIGELLVRREDSQPLKAALGVFSGTIAATLVKLSVSGAIAFFFVKGAVGLF